MNEVNRPINVRYLKPLAQTAAQILLALVLASLVLDGGEIRRQAVVAALAYLALVTLMIARRPEHPTATDLVAIRFSFLPILALVFLAASLR